MRICAMFGCYSWFFVFYCTARLAVCVCVCVCMCVYVCVCELVIAAFVGDIKLIMAALCNRGPLYFCPVISIYRLFFLA